MFKTKLTIEKSIHACLMYCNTVYINFITVIDVSACIYNINALKPLLKPFYLSKKKEKGSNERPVVLYIILYYIKYYYIIYYIILYYTQISTSSTYISFPF